MATRDEYIKVALDTLVDLCDKKNNEMNEEQYGRRVAAEAILHHFRESAVALPHE